MPQSWVAALARACPTVGQAPRGLPGYAGSASELRGTLTPSLSRRERGLVPRAYWGAGTVPGAVDGPAGFVTAPTACAVRHTRVRKTVSCGSVWLPLGPGEGGGSSLIVSHGSKTGSSPEPSCGCGVGTGAGPIAGSGGPPGAGASADAPTLPVGTGAAAPAPAVSRTRDVYTVTGTRAS